MTNRYNLNDTLVVRRDAAVYEGKVKSIYGYGVSTIYVIKTTCGEMFHGKEECFERKATYQQAPSQHLQEADKDGRRDVVNF